MNIEENRRRSRDEQRPRMPKVAGVHVREDDVEPVMGLHWVAWLFRALAVLVFVLMVLQLTLGLTSTVELSVGVLFAEAVRMLILASLLWAAGALADLFVRSHHDLRATRVLLTRIAYRLREESSSAPPSGAPDLASGRPVGPGSDDAAFRH
jgi:hypothetical protein